MNRKFLLIISLATTSIMALGCGSGRSTTTPQTPETPVVSQEGENRDGLPDWRRWDRSNSESYSYEYGFHERLSQRDDWCRYSARTWEKGEGNCKLLGDRSVNCSKRDEEKVCHHDKKEDEVPADSEQPSTAPEGAQDQSQSEQESSSPVQPSATPEDQSDGSSVTPPATPQEEQSEEEFLSSDGICCHISTAEELDAAFQGARAEEKKLLVIYTGPDVSELDAGFQSALTNYMNVNRERVHVVIFQDNGTSEGDHLLRHELGVTKRSGIQGYLFAGRSLQEQFESTFQLRLWLRVRR